MGYPCFSFSHNYKIFLPVVEYVLDLVCVFGLAGGAGYLRANCYSRPLFGPKNFLIYELSFLRVFVCVCLGEFATAVRR